MRVIDRNRSTAFDDFHKPVRGPPQAFLVAVALVGVLVLWGSIPTFHGTSSLTHNSCFSVGFWSHAAVLASNTILAVYPWVHFD